MPDNGTRASDSKVYVGSRRTGSPIVTVIDGGTQYLLRPSRSQRVLNHSPDGFEWGYSGSGPAQLALAILLDLHSGRGNDRAVRQHQTLKAKLIAGLPFDAWTLTAEQIDAAVAS